MNPSYEALLNELFDELDADKSEFLDIRAFVTLGEAMNGVPVSTRQAQAQLDRADKDGDGMVSRREWIEFSAMLGRLDEQTFTKVIGGYLTTVKKMHEKRRSRVSTVTMK
mmetsp:Transcript_7330/g.12170  ORF Transcript_7330/g.12170 Transcript_7330/m.12170 type:complete len:110 (-) Transcript_7330:51-380(-)